MYINETSDEGSLAATMDVWDDSSSTIKATVKVRNPLDTSEWFEFYVSGNITDAGTYRKVPITPIASNGTILNGTSVLLGVFRNGDAGIGAVDSFNGRTGVVVPVSGDYVKGDVGLGNVDNTSDADKPVSAAQQTALNGKVGTSGAETIAGVKTFSSDPIVPDEAYGAGWDGSLEVPTKNAVYDKVESLGGALEFITTLAPSGVTYAEFTAFDATKYSDYLFSFQNLIPATDGGSLYARTSTDGGLNWDAGASDYSCALGYAQVGHIDGATGYNATSAALLVNAVGSDIDEEGLSGRMWLHGPHLTKRTMFTGDFANRQSNSNHLSRHVSWVRLSNGDVDGVQFHFNPGLIESGYIHVYGLRKS